jgi:hypothetical protein
MVDEGELANPEVTISKYHKGLARVQRLYIAYFGRFYK